ncbi:MAG TPA: amino acid dehydrogenase, partial [Rubrivivax sp.]|nr:amino acid dehydrogenase [Rubrivivax sp.]
VLGSSRSAGIWLNLGHGSSGWALACGSARVLADLMARREPAIDITGLGPQRLQP